MMITQTLQNEVTARVLLTKKEINKIVPVGTTEVFKIWEPIDVKRPWYVGFYFGGDWCSLSLSEFCRATELDEEELKSRVEKWKNCWPGVWDQFHDWTDYVRYREPKFSWRRRSPTQAPTVKEIVNDAKS